MNDGQTPSETDRDASGDRGPKSQFASDESPPGHAQAAKTYRVSKRISLSFLIVATVLFSAIFSVLRAFNADPEAYIITILFVTVTSFLQILFPNTPRFASAVCGVLMFVPWFLLWSPELVNTFVVSLIAFLESLIAFSAQLVGLSILITISATIGYATGAIAAGINLVLDRFQKAKE